MADTNDLKIYYPGKILGGDGGALTEYVADSGSLDSLVDAALTQADDFWNGGIIIFLGDTPTVALRGYTAHIKDFVASSDTLTFAKALPAVVATGEKYKLIMGGNYRSNTQVLGQQISGVFPELQPIALVNITGVTVKYVSPGMEFSGLVVDFDSGGPGIILNNSVTYPFLITGNETDLVLRDDDERFIIIDIVFASLPVIDKQDTLILSFQSQTFTPDVDGYESKNALKGKTRYRLQVIKNEGSNTMNSLEVSMTSPVTSTTVGTGETSDLSANTFDVTDGSAFPDGGFWLENTTQNDCRYVQTRSGNAMTVAASNAWTKFVIDANNTVEPFPGDAITGPSGDGIIDSIRLHSGTWAGGDANATIYVKDLTGSFLNTEQIQISAVNIGLANGNDVKGLRDKVGVTWVATDVVRLMSAADFAIQAPSTLQFSDPASETEYPDEALNFVSNQGVLSEAVNIGALTAGSIYGVWFREWIMDGMKTNVGLDASNEFFWS